MSKNGTLVLLAAALFVPAHMAAQGGAMSKGTTEAAGFAGVADGEATFGGSFGKSVTDSVFVLGEASYIAGGSSNAFGIRASTNAINIHGGLHYNFRIGERFVPYGAAGLGMTRVSASSSGGGMSFSASDSSLFFNFGGGARYYIGPRWGIRPEIMIFAGDGSYARFAVGLFYQF